MSIESADQHEIEKASQEYSDALSNFLAAPSFSTKQQAMELLLRQITQNSLPVVTRAASA